MAIVGSGDYRYEVVPSWPKMPRYWSFGQAINGAVNSSDEIHIFDRGPHPVTIWDTEGNFISSWGEGMFRYPHGISIAPNDNVWLVDSHNHVATQHTPDGEIVQTLGKMLVPKASFHGLPFNMPTGLAIAPSGELFVSDGYGGHRVHKFTPQGELLLSWGKEGTGPGEFVNLHGIGVDKQSRVFICDRENNRIQIFDAQGDFLEQWAMQAPSEIWFQDDVVYVSGGEGLRIWSLDGTLITRIGSDEGPQPDSIVGGHGLCGDSQGSLYCISSTVTKLQRV